MSSFLRASGYCSTWEVPAFLSLEETQKSRKIISVTAGLSLLDERFRNELNLPE